MCSQYGKVHEMQIGHESSNLLKPAAHQQLIDREQVHGRRTENKDSRLLQLDLMIGGQSRVTQSKEINSQSSRLQFHRFDYRKIRYRKELIARSIHELGSRQREPFLAINLRSSYRITT